MTVAAFRSMLRRQPFASLLDASVLLVLYVRGWPANTSNRIGRCLSSDSVRKHIVISSVTTTTITRLIRCRHQHSTANFHHRSISFISFPTKLHCQTYHHSYSRQQQHLSKSSSLLNERQERGWTTRSTTTTTTKILMNPPRRSARLLALHGESLPIDRSELLDHNSNSNNNCDQSSARTTRHRKKRIRKVTATENFPSEIEETTTSTASSSTTCFDQGILKQSNDVLNDEDPPFSRKKKRKASSEGKAINHSKLLTTCLARTRERQLLDDSTASILHVMGIDEAGRGPLAGPVVAAAAMVPTDIPGIIDSKKLTHEADREVLYERIVSSPNVRWAVAIVDAGRIDEINILQATLQGMKLAAQAVLSLPVSNLQDQPCISHNGTYVCRSQTDGNGQLMTDWGIGTTLEASSVVALIDGNRLPPEMPCQAEAIIKGDSKEYCIAAASILAKVTRDRLMAGYAALFPVYDWQQNKGYPTAAHMAAVRRHGASPIHRRTFAPLKHMEFDEQGKVAGVKAQA